MDGQRIAHYEIQSRLGGGGMGEVWKAYDPKLQRTVAIKVLKDQTEDAAGRILAEARAASALNHPHICTIYEVDEADGQSFIVMEHVEGQPLSELIRSDGLPPESVIRYGTQIADALGHAHEHGIVHRDLKSANVVITPEAQVKLIDFGIAVPLPQADAEAVTKTREARSNAGTLCGTLAYMAPEVLRGEVATTKSDIWSLGVLLSEMASGRLPFGGATGADLASSILRDSPTFPPERAPTGVRAVVARCLAKEVGGRYPSAASVQAALEVSAETKPARTVPRWVGTGVTASIAVALLAVLGWWYQSPSPDRAAGLAGRPAIAVLPFENLSGDPEQSIFADGLAEDLITRLGSWRSFPVIARASSFNPDLPKDIKQAGLELHAQYVVAGSVRKAQDRIRINVQLIDTASGRNVWANQYDRDFSDVLALQDEITETIIGEVNPDLLQFESELAMHEDSANLDAWTTAMQGWWHFNQRTPENMAKAVELFERAVELDPQFGYAYAGLARAHYWELGPDSPERTVGEILAAAESAVALDEFGAEAHHALGHAFAVTGQTDRMIGAFALGVELNPSNAQANTCYGAHLAWVGRGEEAIEALTRAMSISPRDPWAFSYRTSMAWAYFAIQDYEHALEWAEEGIERRPNRRAYQVAVASLGQLGQLDRAETSLRELLRLQPDLSVAGLELMFAPANRDFVDRLLEGLRKAGWQA